MMGLGIGENGDEVERCEKVGSDRWWWRCASGGRWHGFLG